MQKKGYKLPRGLLTNADLTRLINSDEIQSIVRPPKAGRAQCVSHPPPVPALSALFVHASSFCMPSRGQKCTPGVHSCRAIVVLEDLLCNTYRKL